jgi:hypothetical protein
MSRLLFIITIKLRFAGVVAPTGNNLLIQAVVEWGPADGRIATALYADALLLPDG